MDKQQPVREQKRIWLKSGSILLVLALLAVRASLLLASLSGVVFSPELEVFNQVLRWITWIGVIAPATWYSYRKYTYGEKFPGFVLTGLPRPVQIAGGILFVVDLLIALACIVLLLR